MSHQSTPASIISPSRRGACPTLDKPMQTGDGLLARIRVERRTLTPVQLAALSQLAITHGNGLLEISARGNLQARGLRPETAPHFARAVTDLVPLETGLVVDTSPLAGNDPLEKADTRPLVAAICHGALPLQDKLGPKVSVVVDGGGQIALTAIKADVRLLALDATHWAVHLGGGKPQVMDAEAAVSATLALLAALAALGPAARANDLFPKASVAMACPSPANGPGWGAAMLKTRSGHARPITLPFSQMHGSALIALADAAEAAGVATLRLAPAHRLLLDNAPDSLVESALSLGFITDPADARLRASACIGSEGCASGHIAARSIAGRLSAMIPANQHLHVSGCAKGCAHPQPSDITLVGREDGIGLVIKGRAGDTPQHILDEAGLVPALAARQDAR
nr:precorrin-3B synthase [Devosia chinhatensis]